MASRTILQAFGVIIVATGISLSAQAANPGSNVVPILSLLLLGDIDYQEVTSTTGRVWLDRNLGAARVAESVSDTSAYGHLYQWGRLADGHQKRTSATTITLSSTDIPGHGLFITTDTPYDWRDPQNPNLWQGAVGINNPCPSGFRIPTETEFFQEKNSWISQNAAGAFASPMKLVAAGYRNHYAGGLEKSGTEGRYWTSTAFVFSSPPNIYWARNLTFTDTLAPIHNSVLAAGFSVRCIKH